MFTRFHAALLLAVVVLAAVAFSFAPFLRRAQTPSLAENSGSNSGATEIGNAFGPGVASPPPVFPTGSTPPSSSGNSKTNFLPAPVSRPAPTATQTPTLDLPAVPQSELAISSDGADSPLAYLEYFVVHATSGIPIDPSLQKKILADEHGRPYLVTELVDQALGNGNFARVHGSLAAYQTILATKISFERSIKVKGDGIAFGEMMVGFDELTLQLIDKAFAVERGSISTTDLKNFYGEYSATALAAHDKLYGKIAAMVRDHRDPIASALRFFSFAPTAYAQVPVFGGPILDSFYFVILFYYVGQILTVGPPVPVPNLLVTWQYYLTPAVFPYKNIWEEGVWVLGIYVPAVPFSYPIIMGTSAAPGV